MPDFRKLVARFGSDLSGLDKGLQDANAKLDRFEKEQQSKYGALSDKARSTGLGMSAAITAPLMLVGKASIDAAMEAIETQNKFDVAFKDSANQAQQWADKFSQSVGGLDVTRLQEYSGQFQLLFNAMEVNRGEATKMSTSLTQLSYDLASLYNTSIDEAFTRLQSGLVGETEAVRRFGVDVSEASLKQEAMRRGLGKNVEEMSQSEKVLLRYSMIMKQTGDAQGDLARTSGSAANQTRLMQEQFKAAERELGQELIPVYLKAIGAARGLIKAFTDLDPAGKKASVGIAATLAVAGPLLVILPSLVTGITLVGKAFLFAFGTPLGLAITAAVIGIELLTEKIIRSRNEVERLQNRAQHTPDAMQKQIDTGRDARLRGMSASGLENYRKSQMDAIKEANARAKEAQRGDAWWKPGSAIAHRDVIEAQNEAKRIQGVLDAIDAEKARRKSPAGPSGIDKMSDENKKAIAGLEAGNADAKRQLWILKQTTETEREKARIEVDYKKSTEDILAKQKEVFDKTGVLVNVTDQLAAAKADYTDKLAEIRKQAEQERSELSKTQAENAKSLAALQADEVFEEKLASGRIKALESGDEYTSQEVEAAASFLSGVRELAKKAEEGVPVAQRALELQSQFFKTIAGIKKQRADAAAEAASEAAEKSAMQNDSIIGTYFERQAVGAEMAGESSNAALIRAKAEAIASLSELDRRKDLSDKARQDMQALTREKYALAEKKLNDEAAKSEAAAVQEKIKAIRDEAQERERAYNDEMNRKKSMIEFTTPEEYSRSVLKTGFTSRYRTMQPSRDTAMPPTSGEVSYAVAKLREEQAINNRLTEQLILEVQRLRGHGGNRNMGGGR